MDRRPAAVGRPARSAPAPSERSSARRGPGDAQVVVEDDDGVAAGADQRPEVGLAAAQAGRHARCSSRAVTQPVHARRARRRRRCRRWPRALGRMPLRASAPVTTTATSIARCGRTWPSSVGPARRPGRAATRRSGRGRSAPRGPAASRPATTRKRAAVGTRSACPRSRADVLRPRPAVSRTAPAEQHERHRLAAGLDGAQQGQGGGHRRGGDDHGGAEDQLLLEPEPGPAAQPGRRRAAGRRRGRRRVNRATSTASRRPAASSRRRSTSVRTPTIGEQVARNGRAPSGGRRGRAGRPGRRRPPAPCPTAGSSGAIASRRQPRPALPAAAADDPDEDGDDQPGGGDGEVTERAQRRELAATARRRRSPAPRPRAATIDAGPHPSVSAVLTAR